MRGRERMKLDQPARLHPNDWSSIEVRLLDVSDLGFRAQCEAKVVVGLIVRIELPGLEPQDARVVWQRDGQFGAHFLKAVDIDRCSWTPASQEIVLARLLVQRATALRTGRYAEEQHLREHIRSALPIRRPDS